MCVCVCVYFRLCERAYALLIKSCATIKLGILVTCTAIETILLKLCIYLDHVSEQISISLKSFEEGR